MWRSRRLEGESRIQEFRSRNSEFSTEVFMSPGILGKKIGMSQVFRADGQVVPVTLLKAGPCVVVQRKTPTTDGYDAVQLGLVEFAKASRTTKPMAGHLKKASADGVKFLREVPHAAGRRRSEAGRSRAGGSVQAGRQGGRDRRQQGPRLHQPHQAASFQGRSRQPWIDVSSRAGIHRRVQLSVARVPGNPHGRPHRATSR